MEEINSADLTAFLVEIYAASRKVSKSEVTERLASSLENDPEWTRRLFRDTDSYKTSLDRVGISDRNFDHEVSRSAYVWQIVLAVILFPVTLIFYALAPAVPSIATFFAREKQDRIYFKRKGGATVTSLRTLRRLIFERLDSLMN